MALDWRRSALRAVLLLGVGTALMLLNGVGWLWSAGLILLGLGVDDAKDAVRARRACVPTSRDTSAR